MAENESMQSKSTAQESTVPSEKPGDLEAVPKGPLHLPVEKPVTVMLDEETTVEQLLPQAPQGEKPAPAAEPAAKRNSPVGPLRTYRDDISKTLQKGGVSYLSMATAEYARRGALGIPLPATRRNLLLLGSIGLIVGGLVVASLVYFLKPGGETETPTGLAVLPLIFAEERVEINVTGYDRKKLLASLSGERAAIQQKIGSITHLSLTREAPEGTELLAAAEFLRIIDARVPASFLRSLGNNFMFGYYEANGNQPFLIFKTDSYGEAYAGMLAWEPYLRLDLSPVFTFNAVSTGEAATTTTAASTPKTTSIGGDRFRDRVIKNKDVRILFNPDNSVLLLYALPDQQTIVIATSEATLNEVAARLTTSRNR